MTPLLAAISDHPATSFILAAAALAILEMVTGTGWALWPAAAAAACAVLALALRPSWAVEAACFAGLTLLLTLLGRPWLAFRRAHGAADINNAAAELLGRTAEVVTPFDNGRGRVFVMGKEWAAEASPAAPLAVGDAVKVVKLVSGSRLEVAPM